MNVIYLQLNLKKKIAGFLSYYFIKIGHILNVQQSTCTYFSGFFYFFRIHCVLYK